MIYTEVESHRASLRERISVVRLLWAVSAQPGISRRTRWRLRRMTLGIYIKPSARVSSYIVSHAGE